MNMDGKDTTVENVEDPAQALEEQPKPVRRLRVRTQVRAGVTPPSGGLPTGPKVISHASPNYYW